MPGFLLNCITTINSSGAATTTSGCVLPNGITATGNSSRISTGFPTAVPTPAITPSVAVTPAQQAAGGAPAVGAFDPNIKNPSVHEWDLRSEERRVGKECRSRWSPYH